MPEQEKKSSRITITTVIAMIALLTGGLGGAFFNAWWSNRSTVVTYTTTSTTLGADQRVKSLVPDIKIQVGAQEIPFIHLHTIELRPQSGPYAEKADIAIAFPPSVHLLSKAVVETATPLHKMTCTDATQNTLTCQMSPVLARNGFYRVSFAVTADNTGPTISMVAKGVELAKTETALANDQEKLISSVVGFGLGAGLTSMAFFYIARKLQALAERISKYAIARSIPNE